MAKRLHELRGGRFLFRSMMEEDGQPSLGPTNYQLGVRTGVAAGSSCYRETAAYRGRAWSTMVEVERTEMPTLTQTYDEALHALPAPSTLMAEALRALIEAQLTRGEYTREEAFAALQSLFEQYADEGRTDEREAVADVIDCFVGWSPPGASL